MKGLEAGDHSSLQSSLWRSIVIICCVLCMLVLVVFVNTDSTHPSTFLPSQQQEDVEEKNVNAFERIGGQNTRNLLQQDEDEEDSKKSRKKAAEKAKKVDTKSNKKSGGKAHPATLCDSPTYANTSLKLVLEMHMDYLFPNRGKENKFEGSDVVYVGDFFYVVFDNLWSIGKINAHNFSSPTNYLLPQSRGLSGSSGYEAIAYDEQTKQYYMIIESEPTSSPTVNYGMIEQERITDQTLLTTFVQHCSSEFIFTYPNKGFEGAAIVRVANRMYMIGLCEGNFCVGGSQGREAGNGRLIIMQRRPATASAPCMWRTIKEIHLPTTAYFQDYSALALRKTNSSSSNNGTDVYDVAITSQENSLLWISKLSIGPSLDLSDWQFAPGTVYSFPRDPDNCAMLYCSVEGIAFLPDNKFVAVSDKDGGTASGCPMHDENIHIFQLP